MDFTTFEKNNNYSSSTITDFPLTSNINAPYNTNEIQQYYSSESPYKFPPLIICPDTKRMNHSTEIYKKYMDVIVDDCGNRFNIHNQRDSAGLLQAGYSANIDLDSHLKNINYYNDKCFYNNWKLAPNANVTTTNLGISSVCNGLNRNAGLLMKDYKQVQPVSIVDNVYNVRDRYKFNDIGMIKETCIKPEEWRYFEKVPHVSSSSANQHDYYKFFESTPCMIIPNQRLFNNITKRSMLPNNHFTNIDPIRK